MGFIDDKRTVSLNEKPVKPRRAKGTAAAKARNRFASAVLAGSALCGVLYMFLPTNSKVKNFMKDFWVQGPPIDERVKVVTFVGERKSSVDIEKLLSDLGKPTQ